MRILFIAFSNSIHTARWINQVSDLGWDIHIFPSIDLDGVHPQIRNVTVHHSFYGLRHSGRPETFGEHDKSVKQRGIPIVIPKISWYIGYIIRIALQQTRFGGYRQWQLARLIKRLKPDIIHSLEFQSGAYLTNSVKKAYKGKFPPWIATNWGSDIYLFGRLKEHSEKIKDVLISCDYYSCENQRDIQLALDMGLKGRILPVVPNTGGFDLQKVAQLREPGPTSSRKIILVKGYQGWAGRAFVALRALALSADIIKDYLIAIYLAGDDVKIAAELLARETGLNIEIIPYVSHEEMLRWYGKSRIYIGLSISDAIPTSLLESMVMGAFPIQSNTGAAKEWIIDGKSGFIVHPEDPAPVAVALKKAVADNSLVDRASEINWQVAKERLDQNIVKPQVIQIYETVFKDNQIKYRK
jgi:glycosyltransferase involved in cell wall biosynthesis